MIELPSLNRDDIIVRYGRGPTDVEFFTVAHDETSSWKRGSVKVVDLRHGGTQGTIFLHSLSTNRIVIERVYCTNDSVFKTNYPSYFSGLMVATKEDVQKIKTIYNERINAAQQQNSMLETVEARLKN